MYARDKHYTRYPVPSVAGLDPGSRSEDSNHIFQIYTFFLDPEPDPEPNPNLVWWFNIKQTKFSEPTVPNI